jgi:hypothetical protein
MTHTLLIVASSCCQILVTINLRTLSLTFNIDVYGGCPHVELVTQCRFYNEGAYQATDHVLKSLGSLRNRQDFDVELEVGFE